ncbi:MAG TPA: prepilin-type N-terminal cleavage/methylation domain-containing protein [Chthoniobacteraceae bacterium]|nr:prepilin-type N-terminal cleavage/methylation domain-containing protein [Chthoniobacteraceae bacterium]
MRGPRLRTGRKDPSGGFTLVEALVALAVLLILVILTGYGVAQVRKAGLGIKNMQSHRTIAAALLAYATEHGRLPYAREEKAVSSAPFAGQEVTYPRTLTALGYITDPSIFFGPQAGQWYTSYSKVLQHPQTGSTIPWYYTNYGVNRTGAMPKNEKGYLPARLSDIASDGNLSKLMLLRDCYDASMDTATSRRGGGVVFFAGTTEMPPPEKTYQGKVYATFADGHTVAYPREALIELLKNNPNGEPPLFGRKYIVKP